MLGDATDGTDDCQFDAVCMFPDDQGAGKCHTLCNIDGQGGPSCAPGLECFGPFCQRCYWGYCDTSCDPREPDACNAGDVCITAGGDQWTCTVDASGDEGQAGDPCEFANACDPGLQCLNADAVAGGCGDAASCCAPTCSTDEPNTCPNAAQGDACVPWYSPGQAPPQLMTLGVCALPQ